MHVMKRHFTGQTDTGLLRSVNQDDYYIDPDGRYFIVADGMGGHAGGQEASRIATEIIQTYLNDNWHGEESSADLLQNALLKANQAILQDQSANPERADMGTTAVVVLLRQEEPWCAHIGDSRIYRLRGAKLEQITEDHTWVAMAMKAGSITPDQARVHPWRHILSRCLGRDDVRQVDVQSFEIQSADRLLLCSDGLTEEVADTQIATHLRNIRSCDMVAETLISTAKENGGRDNITVVIVAFDEDDVTTIS
jgi:PPM family protein phosphatase